MLPLPITPIFLMRQTIRIALYQTAARRLSLMEGQPVDVGKASWSDG
jgi:hypothetical protein